MAGETSLEVALETALEMATPDSALVTALEMAPPASALETALEMAGPAAALETTLEMVGMQLCLPTHRHRPEHFDDPGSEELGLGGRRPCCVSTKKNKSGMSENCYLSQQKINEN